MTGSLIFWRHGQTVFNTERRFQGHIDTPLSPVGLSQAAQAAGALAAREPALIVSSDLDRARTTARALEERTGTPALTDARLRERSYGPWEGLRIEEIAEHYPEDLDRWRNGLDPLTCDIETRRAAAERAVAAVDEHRDAADGGPVVFVSHGGLITCVVAALLGQDPAAWLGLRVLDNCHWAELAANPGRSPGWRLVAYNQYPA